jgi:hypothetical protein
MGDNIKNIHNIMIDVAKYIHDVVKAEDSLNKILLQKRIYYIIYFGLLIFTYLFVMATKYLQKPRFYCMIAVFTLFPIYVEYGSYYMLYLTKSTIENISNNSSIIYSAFSMTLLIPILLLLLAPISMHLAWFWVKMPKYVNAQKKRYADINENRNIITELQKTVDNYQKTEQALIDIYPKAKHIINSFKNNNIKEMNNK